MRKAEFCRIPSKRRNYNGFAPVLKLFCLNPAGESGVNCDGPWPPGSFRKARRCTVHGQRSDWLPVVRSGRGLEEAGETTV